VGQPDAMDVLRMLGTLYGAMISYSDRGMVSTTSARTGNLGQTRFSTLYQKPSLFRFECFRPHPYPPLSHLVTQHVIGFDGTAAYSQKRPERNPETAASIDDLSSAVAAAVPSSRGASLTVARLLVPEVQGFSILDLVNPQIKEETHIDGIVCHAITARHSKGDGYELWVERDSLLLRKVIQTSALGRSEEVHESIRVNEPINCELFATQV
jgi:hypothetical protein